MSTSSPWTYLGSQLITEMAKSSGYEINIYPVNFGQIFPVSGGLPLPKRAPQRQAYRLMELQRWKKKRGSTMHIEPSNFPSASPISSLCIIAARENGNDALILANAILAALWEDDRNIDDPEVLKNICFAFAGNLPSNAIEIFNNFELPYSKQKNFSNKIPSHKSLIKNGKKIIKFKEIEFSRIFTAWQIPSNKDQKFILAFEMLASILCDGHNGKLIRPFKEENNLVESVYADVH